MNLLPRLFAVGTLLTSAASLTADTFQGKVSLAITAAKGQTQVLNYSIKDQKLRMDIEAKGQTFASIMDMEKLEVMMLMPEQQMYMVMPLKKPIEKAMASQGESTADIEVTGKTDTILGYKCNQIIVKDKNTVTEMWVAEGLGTFMGMGNQGGGSPFGGGRPAAAAKWEEALKGKGGFPLRVVTQDAKKKETFRMEATNIEPGTLPASLFVPPEGFKKFDMGGLMRGAFGQ